MLSQNNNALGIIFPNSYDTTVPELVTERAMASIPFAGRYRMVDFVLSSMANCGISNVSIVVRKNYHSLMDHLGTGREWDMARRHGGLNIVPPFAEKGVRIYSGRVEALGSILNFLENQKERYVVMSDANIAINYDFNALLAAHQASGADVTIAYQKTEIPEGRKNDNYTLTVDADGRCFAEAADLDNFQAVAIGPGLGQEEITVQALFDQVSNCYIPLVLDADALNIFSNYRNYLTRIPRHSILTPHVKELERIIGRCSNSYERLSKAKELAAHLQCYIVLKGAWSAVITPDGVTYFNPTGNPGMATAGSGDVLTGIILSLLSQGYTHEEACRLGVYVHGLAGDIACQQKGVISMTSGDIVEALPEAWKQLMETK